MGRRFDVGLGLGARRRLLRGVSYWAWYEAMRCLGMARGVALNITYAAWSVLWGMLGLCAPLEGMLPLVGAALVLVGGLLAAFSERGGRKRAF